MRHPPSNSSLEQADFPFDGSDQLRRIVADTFLEHERHLPNIVDARGGITVQHDEVSLFTDRDRADAIRATEVRRTVERRDLDRFERRESALDEQLDGALI